MCPVGVGPGGIRARLGCGGPLPGGPGGLLVLVRLNAADPLRGAGPIEDARALLDSAGVPYFQSFVRRYVSVPSSQLDGLPITAYRGDGSWRKALDDARRVQVELLIELGRLSSKAGVS